MTIWVSKWALKDGTIARYDDAEAVTVRGKKGDRNCAVVRRKGCKPMKFWPGEWHPTAAAAITRAEDNRRSVLEGLARHADLVASLRFKVSP